MFQTPNPTICCKTLAHAHISIFEGRVLFLVLMSRVGALNGFVADPTLISLYLVMSSAECSMGLRSFLAHDEPLSAGRLKMTDGRLCEELEIKSLMRSSPLTHSSTNGYSTKHNGGSMTTTSKQHTYEYCEFFPELYIPLQIPR